MQFPWRYIVTLFVLFRFVLLQECVWFNYVICHIRQQLHLLRSSLFATSDYQLSQALRDTANSLAMEEVPKTWYIKSFFILAVVCRSVL